MLYTLHHPHTLGAAEAKRRIFAFAARPVPKSIELVRQSWEEASKTLTLELRAFGRDTKATAVIGDSDVEVTINDDAGWFIDHFIIDPKVQAMLTEALK